MSQEPPSLPALSIVPIILKDGELAYLLRHYRRAAARCAKLGEEGMDAESLCTSNGVLGQSLCAAVDSAAQAAIPVAVHTTYSSSLT